MINTVKIVMIETFKSKFSHILSLSKNYFNNLSHFASQVIPGNLQKYVSTNRSLLQCETLPAHFSNNIIHLLDRTETNIIFIWSSKVILGEAKPSPNITSPDQINMILGEVLSNKCFIIPAHVVCTRSIARLIDSDQEAIYHVACSAPL